MAQPKRTRRAWIAIGSTLVGVAAIGTVATTGTASAVGTPVVSTNFADATAPGWAYPGTQYGTNAACLSGATSGSLLCANPGGTAGLQLTDTSGFANGGIVYGTQTSTAQGLDVQYTTDQFGATSVDSADGITFFLSSAAPGAITLGAPGGHLGYGADPSGRDLNGNPPTDGIGLDGLTGGYLGVGLDAYGNNGTAAYSGTGCATTDATNAPPFSPGTVNVRGPGSAQAGYCVLASSYAADPGLVLTGSPVPVEVAINPTGLAISPAGIGSGGSVAPGSFAVWVTPVGGTATEVASGPLPAGLPASASFGFTASTGGSNDYHVVTGVSVSSLVKPATQLAFATQPVSTTVGTANPTDIKVAAEAADGTVDPSFNGQVSLAITSGTGASGAGLTPTATLSATAVNGVADFGSPGVDTAGFGYTLSATATGLSTAVSHSFDVNAASTNCAATGTCIVTTTSAATGQAVTISGAGGTNTALTATFGGNVAPIHPCTSAAAGILTFGGAGNKTVALTLSNVKVPVLLFCYGQPTPFLNILYQKTTYTNPLNGGEYEGLLPACLGRITAGYPCISGLSYSLKTKTEVVTVQSGTADPRLSK